MTILAPFALVGILLLILPIAVHLFKPRKMRQTPFSSLRWLKQTHQRLSRRIQWHQWVLFLLRAGCLLLLVLALAKPLIGTWAESRPTERFLVVDGSRSMGLQVEGQPTPLQRATDLADKIVQHTRPGDRTALVLAGSLPRLISPPDADAREHLATLNAAPPGLADTSVSAALPLVRALLDPQDERAVELVFLTDNLQQRWRQPDVQAFLTDLPRPVHVKVIETGAGPVHNAWIANTRLFEFGPDKERVLRVEAGCVQEAPVVRSVRLTGIAGMADQTPEIALKPGRIAYVDFTIPAHAAGQIGELRLLPADALPSDDVLLLNLDTAGALQVLVIEPEVPGPDGLKVGHFLRGALAALVKARKQTLHVETRAFTAVTAADFRKADVIVLAGVPELSDAALESLETRVQGGAGLAIFLGPQIKTAFYNQKLHRPHQPAQQLMSLGLRTPGPFVVGKPGTLTNLRRTHPLLAALQDPVLSDLTRSRFHICCALEGTSPKTDTVLARFDDDVPAIIDRPVGKGRVLLFNTTADTEWSDLPKHPSFLVLLDRMLTILSAGGSQRSFLVGDAVNLPLPDLQTGTEVVVVAPNGAKLSRRLLDLRGQKMLHLDSVAEAGVHRVEGAGLKEFVFVVNTGRSDSPLSPMNAKVLEEWWAPATLEIVSAETATQSLNQQSGQWPLWPLLVLVAALLLMGETIYVHLLCPRANPKAAEAVVPQVGGLVVKKR